MQFIGVLVFYATPLWIRSAMGEIDWDHHQKVRQKFCKALMRIYNIEIEVYGKPYKEGPCVYTSNHRSWMDPFVMLTHVWAFPVAKAEVGDVPFVAAGARATGILFVKRESKSSRRQVIDLMNKELENGHSILIYPEGTTSKPIETKPFQRGGFLVASTSNVPVVPMAIIYDNSELHWGEDETMWENYVKLAFQKKIRVKLFIGEPLDTNLSAKALTTETKEMVDNWISNNLF